MMNIGQHGTAAFLITLLLLLAATVLLPFLRNFLVELLDRIGEAVLRAFRFVRQRYWEVAYGTVTCCVLGLFIAWPTLMHSGYFASASGGESVDEDTPAVGAERSPGAMPPLEYQIDVADCIVIAETEIGQDGKVSFMPQDVWKAPEDCAAAGDSALTPDISSFRLLGYSPKAGQLAVLFLTPGRDSVPQLIELLPVKGDKVVYAPDDSSVRRKLELGELRQLISAPAAASSGEDPAAAAAH